MDIEHDVKIPPELLLVGIQNFPFKGRNVTNFFIQGIAVFIASAACGYLAGHIFSAVCH